jgi:chromosomal replication initiator protein
MSRFASAHAPTVASIMKCVAEFYGTSIEDMTGYRRSRPFVRPRHIAMWLARHLTTLSLPQIGRAFGGRDHTTVLHGVRKVDKLRDAYPGLRRATDELLAHFREIREVSE